MIKPEEIKFLLKAGKTFNQIGEALGVSRQRVHQVYTGYPKIYQHTERYLMFRRHRGHTAHTKLQKPCSYCEGDLSRGLSNLSQ